MYKTQEFGPQFQVESDKALIVLGHSERFEVGQLWAEALDDTGLFPEDIDIVTLNIAAGFLTRKVVRDEMPNRTVFTHSGGLRAVPEALQVIALNPAEPTPLTKLMKGAQAIADDPVQKEAGCHETGFKDLAKAGIELARSPFTSMRTPWLIRKYSSWYDLSEREHDFPAGRAIVHSERDGFGFADKAELGQAALAGITGVMIEEHYHNEVLFAPKVTLNAITPHIL